MVGSKINCIPFIIAFFIAISCKVFAAENGEDSYVFIPNKNQWEEKVLYRANVPGGKFFLQKNAITYSFYDTKKLHENHHGNADSPSDPSFKTAFQAHNLIKMHAVEVEFMGSNENVVVKGNNEGDVLHNYFLGEDKSKWSAGVKSVNEVLYKELYAGIDLKFYSQSDRLKYDFIVAKNSDPSKIKLKYKGADALFIKDGNLVVQTSLRTVYEQKPFAYQIQGMDTLIVACNYVLDNSELHFEFPKGYDKNLELVIDPILIFSTYSGSQADNWGFAATYDDRGNLYSGGIVFDPGFPVTSGAFQTSFSGSIDIGILKYDSTGSRLLYATYLGGGSAEAPHSMMVNGDEELVLLGSTGSTNYPVTENAFQKTFGGGSTISPLSGVNYYNGSDLVLSKLSRDGTTLSGSTYIGGSSNDGLMSQGVTLVKNYGDQFRGELIIDSENHVYVASNTSSIDFPIVDGFQSEYGGGNYDGVVFRMNNDFSNVMWSSYLGGGSADAAYTLRKDHEENIFVGGGTTSADFPTTPGSLNETLSGSIDGFVTKIAGNGSDLLRSSYVGTDQYDQVYLLDLDVQGNVYLLGQTFGDYPVSSWAYNNFKGGHFIHKLDPQLKETIYSTVVGSGNNAINFTPTAFLINECENIFISGWGGTINSLFDPNGNGTGYVGGNTRNLPITEDAFQATTDGSDFYLMVLSKDVRELLYGTYFGGDAGIEHVDGGTSRFDKRGIVYQAVCGDCGEGDSNFPTTPGVWSPTNKAENCNNAAFKFDLATLKANFVTNKVTMDEEGYSKGCAPLTILFQNKSIGGKTFEWKFGDGATSEEKDNVVHTYEEPGTYNVVLKVTDLNTCKKEDFAYGTIRVFKAEFYVGENPEICQGETVQIEAGGGVSYSWTPYAGLDDRNAARPFASPEETTTYYVFIRDKNNCTHQDSVTVTVIPTVTADFSYDFISGCEAKPAIRFTNTSTGAENYQWKINGALVTEEESFDHYFEEPGTYNISLTSGMRICSNEKNVSLELKEFKIPNVFTPNGDEINEYFEITSNVPVNLMIYNRWGKEVYKNPDYQNEWSADGFSTGVYYYEAKLPDKTICKGWLHVLR